ncbi:chaperone modulator CbpM [Actinomadura decatromicini]|uniref:MerR family transcriptional regulator n=1 Tax=Actinomadura decatromicini TaxID=2604572 RepID=A0A5D3F9S4_9ACTN|nr:chaperone modulator CbpM [Actinomadura decatromicini]TYK44095.1 MerR family transcriptional regulator [Actinomadura decatromicini]
MEHLLPGTVYAIIPTRPRLMDLDAFAEAAGIHPETARRLVRLGLLDPERDRSGRLWFPPAQVAAYARLERLRTGLCLNYAALGLVVDLLDRIAELERELRIQHNTGGPTWTPTA